MILFPLRSDYAHRGLHQATLRIAKNSCSLGAPGHTEAPPDTCVSSLLIRSYATGPRLAHSVLAHWGVLVTGRRSATRIGRGENRDRHL
jgi:hypothetical protein